MTRTLHCFLVAGLAAILWVVPSIGTQGMGTVGARFVHPDAVLIDTMPLARSQARDALIRADSVAESALGLPSPAV